MQDSCDSCPVEGEGCPYVRGPDKGGSTVLCYVLLSYSGTSDKQGRRQQVKVGGEVKEFMCRQSHAPLLQY